MEKVEEKVNRKLLLDYQNDKQSIRLEAETKEDRVDEERIRMLRAKEFLDQDFLKLQEVNGVNFEAIEMNEEEKDIMWRKNNQLRRVRKKDFTEKELERIQERIKKVSFDELDEVANQQKIQTEIKNVKASTSFLREKYDVLPEIANFSAENEDNALEKTKYEFLVKNAILSAKNEIQNDQLMLQQKISQYEEITTAKELQILESKMEMGMAFKNIRLS